MNIKLLDVLLNVLRVKTIISSVLEEDRSILQSPSALDEAISLLSESSDVLVNLDEVKAITIADLSDEQKIAMQLITS